MMNQVVSGLIVAAVFVMVAGHAFGQPSYYDSRARQNAEYRNLSNATNRAYAVPDRPASTPSPTRTSSSSSSSGGASRPTGSSGSSASGRTPAYVPPAKVENTNAEVIAEHNAWLRKVRAEDAAEAKARAENRRSEQRAADYERAALLSEKARAPEVLAMAAQIETNGFTATEAFYLAYQIVPQAEGATPVSEQERKYLQEAHLARKRFSERRAAASYAELRELTNLFMTATVTAMNAYQSMAVRFPEKLAETELLEIGSMPYIWGGTKTWNTWLQADRATDGEKREVVDRYRELAAKHPEKARAMRESLSSDASRRFEVALAAAK